MFSTHYLLCWTFDAAVSADCLSEFCRKIATSCPAYFLPHDAAGSSRLHVVVVAVRHASLPNRVCCSCTSALHMRQLTAIVSNFGRHLREFWNQNPFLKKGLAILYFRQITGEVHVFTRFLSFCLCVCLIVCVQRRDVKILMTSCYVTSRLCMVCDVTSGNVW